MRYRTEWVEPPKDGTEPEANLALLRETGATGYHLAGTVDGGIVFFSGQLFGAYLLYADGGKAGADALTCRAPRAIGGRWYTADCQSGESGER